MVKDYNLTKSAFRENKALVHLHQENDVISIELDECDITPFIGRLREQIEKVEIKFMPDAKATVDIYFLVMY